MHPTDPSHRPTLPVCSACGHPHLPGEPCTSPRFAGLGSGTLALDPEDEPRTASQAADPLVGATVGSFRVVRLLGRGGMGSVYLAEHPIIGSRVAIKFLHESMATSPELVNRFYDEARAVNRIGHENIVGIFDLSMLPPNRYYIVMEYLDGDALSAVLHRGTPPLGETLAILLQLCDALQCAHERGVVHRDLKPDNVFVLRRRGQPFVKLLDFGIAKLRDTSAASTTASGTLMGTPEYMAPEQCDDRPVDARTDVYALGVMAYQMLCGVLPFTGSIAQLLVAHLRETPRPPRSVNGLLPPALEDVVQRALAKAPADRFPDMAAFAAALEAAAPSRVPSPSSAIPTPPPVSPAASAAPAAVAAERAGPVLRVQLPGEASPRALAASGLSRAGVHLAAAPPLPALRSRVVVSVPGSTGTVEVPAEVVRVVEPADAGRFGMPAGFALQFMPSTPGERVALERIAAAAAPPRAPGGEDAVAAALVDALDARAAGTHYALLDLPLDAELKEAQSRARSLRLQLERLRDRQLSAARAARVGPLLARLTLAGDVLGSPAERLPYDLRIGNHLGVARCISSGLPEALLDQRRRDFLRERPGAEERARQCLSRAKVARAVGNLAFARAQYEEALSHDPLDLEAQREYWAVRRQAGGLE
ncbi:MAG TPA: serine/threonine-protein kinase [Anaeromyxobacteraceae bacterium]|nr:serine/threonine-protein kinase [Anaeromyxobacteraceae bacterium]